MSPDRAKPSLVVISGPTGSGKTTIAKRLVTELPRAVFSVSHTTRQPRPGEKDGKDYHFITEDAFRKMVDAGEFLEWAAVHGQLYGTHRSEWEKAAAAGLDLILDIDVQGGAQVLASDPSAVLIFILPPSFEEMLSRVTKRRGEKHFDLERRLRTALDELDFAGGYHYNVKNGEVRLAVEEVKEILRTAGKKCSPLEEERNELKRKIENWLREKDVQS